MMNEQHTQDRQPENNEPQADDVESERFRQLLDEAHALTLYVARHGDVLEPDETDQPDETATTPRDDYERLVEDLANATSRPRGESFKALMESYARVTAVTYRKRGVNGRTLLDTWKQPSKRWGILRLPKFRPIIFGTVFVVLVAVMTVAAAWTGQTGTPDKLGDWCKSLHMVTGPVAALVLPALWGGIGACVFLMKRISDKLYQMAYEQGRQHGIVPRIFVGAVLGLVVVVFLFPDYSAKIKNGDMDLSPAMAAFVAGLGVKPVYAAFEALSEGIARRIRGGDTPTRR